jgi:outer membrane protein OmpA-like peptidoglycan-associated protein
MARLYCHTGLILLLLLVIALPFSAAAQQKKKRKKQSRAAANFTTSRYSHASAGAFSLEDDPIKKSGRIMKPGATRPAGGASMPCPDLKPDVRISSSKNTALITYQGAPNLTYEPPPQETVPELVMPPKKDTTPTTVSTGKPPKPTLRPLYFVFDEDELTKEDMETIRNAAAYVQYGYKIVIEGHTDSFGSDFYNERLSRKRAERIKDIMLKTTGISEEMVSVQAWGESRPAVPNNSPDSRQLNRRVEIKVVD